MALHVRRPEQQHVGVAFLDLPVSELRSPATARSVVIDRLAAQFGLDMRTASETAEDLEERGVRESSG